MEVVLAILVIVLSVVVLLQKKHLNNYNLLNKNLATMSVIENMYNIIGDDLDSKSKFNELNKKIIHTYDIKYSSLVIYDGNDYIVYASNVDEEYHKGIIDIVKEPDIRNNVLKNVSKYLTTSADKTLLYNSAIERNIKSCIFIPIYHKKVYKGFLILEDIVENAFDSISKEQILKLKNCLGVFLNNTLLQNVFEKSKNIDSLTNVYNNIYLYTDVAKKIQKYEHTTLILLHFPNLEEVNSAYTRSIGNKLLVKSIDNMKELISNDAEIVRYSGSKFLVVMYATSSETAHSVAERIYDKIKNNAVEKIDGKYVNLDINMLLTTIKKQANLEIEIQKMSDNIKKYKDEGTIRIM